ncbi:ATP-binding cassette domain-containing protein [bacterium]|nr:ATP-binding cassette domain-containing protein [bacterium]
MGDKSIHLIGVTKIFDPPKGEPVVAVNGLDLTIPEGEIFGLLGPNGAGKTTTLRMISTLLQPTRGKILIDGHDTVTESDKVRRKLGFLSGNTGLYKRLKACEMVEFFGRLYGMNEVFLKNRVDELFGILDMKQYAETMCDSLSSGTKQKVNIARTMVHDPPILVFDEPTVGLDVMVARSLTDFILSLKKNRKTVIFSTHIMREAERLCDRIGIIHQGSLLSVGTLEELLDQTNTSNLEDAFFELTGTEELIF